MRTVVFDNEAVQALTESTHPQHRTVLAHLAGAVSRRRRGAVVEVVVPTTARVEAGWDRTTSVAAAINRFRVRDRVLDTTTANLAAAIQRQCGLGPTDAHIGATVRSVDTGDVVVLTSDPSDIAAVCAPLSPRIVRI